MAKPISSMMWRKVRLGDIATVTSGGTPSRSVSEYWNGTVPWISTSEIDFNTVTLAQEYITETGLKNSSAKIFPKGTLVMAMFGHGVTRGKVAVLGIDAAFNQACAAIVPTKGDSSMFLFHYLSYLYPSIRYLGHGSNQPNLNAALIKNIEIYQPSLIEQERIADIANYWDKCVAECHLLIEAKQKLKSGLMQKLLSIAVGFIEIKNLDWKQYALGSLFSERTESGRLDLPLLSITANRGVISRDEVERKDSSSEDKSKYKRITPGDIGYNTMRMWQGVSALSKLEGIISPAYTVCIPNERIDGLFASYLFKYPPMVHLFHRYSQGMVDDTLSLKFPNFAEIKVAIPPIAEQRRIAAVLSTLDREIDLLKKLADLFKQQKKGLMQKLLTGEVQVKAPVAEMEAAS